MLRILHLLVIGCLVSAAVVLYQVKYESTAHVQRIAKLRAEMRAEQDRIAWLRAEWHRLSSPDRIQDLAQRHLSMAASGVVALDEIKGLPDKPDIHADPIGDLIAGLEPAYSYDGAALGALAAGD
jgi:cell division protein FtsL